MPSRFFGLLLVCLFVFVSTAIGQEPVSPGVEVREKTIYIPYEKLRTVFERPDRGVFLPYEEFQKLWEAARIGKVKPVPQEVPIAAMVSEMTAEAVASDEVVRVESVLHIELFKEGWHEIPLRLGDVAITKAEIDGRPARILGEAGEKGYRLLVEKPKSETTAENEEKPGLNPTKIELRLNYAKSIVKAPGRNSVSFDVPQVPLSRWKVVVPESGVKIDFFPLVAASEETATASAETPDLEKTVLQAFVGPVPQVRIGWTPKTEGATGLDALTSVLLTQQSVIDEGILRSTAQFDYSISRATVSQLALRIPADQKVVSVFDPNIRKWWVETPEEAAEDAEGGTRKYQTVVVDLFEPAARQQSVVVELEELFDIGTPRTESDGTASGADAVASGRPRLTIPELSAVGVGRQQGVLVVRAVGELTVETLRQSGLIQMDASELPPSLRQKTWDGAYRISSTAYALELAVNKVEPRITAQSLVELQLDENRLLMDVILLLNIERAGIFRLSVDVPETRSGLTVTGYEAPGVTSMQVDSFTPAPRTEEQEKSGSTLRTLNIHLRRKAQGRVGLRIRLPRDLESTELRTPTGKTVDLPVVLPVLEKNLAERYEGKLVVLAGEAFRIGAAETSGLQAVSVQQVLGDNWNVDVDRTQLGFLFAEQPATLTLQAERRKPQLTLREARTIRIEEGVVRSRASFYYDVRFSGIPSLRIDVPRELSGRLNLRGDGSWRESQLVPQPEDVPENYVAWQFSTKSNLLGSGALELDWEDELTTPDIGRSVPVDIPRLIPHKQQPTDRIWGRLILCKSQGIDLGESETTRGLKPIDPQYDVPQADRADDAVAAYEFHDDWNLQVIATRYKLEDVKRTSIERGLVRANLFSSREGFGVSAQALFRIRSVQQRLELLLPEKASISDVRINGRSIVLESDSGADGATRYMVPLTSVPPDTPFLFDLRYSLPEQSSAMIDIPSFPGTDGDEGPAVQKVYLAAFVPDDQVPIGYRGRWTKDFTFHFEGETTAAWNQPSVSNLSSDLLGGQGDDFSTSGKAFLFSAIQPRSGETLELIVCRDMFGALLFGAVVLLGLLLVPASWTCRFQVVILVLIGCILLGFVCPTFASLLLCHSGIGWGILVVVLCWGTRSLVGFCRVLRERSSISVKVTEPEDKVVAAVPGEEMEQSETPEAFEPTRPENEEGRDENHV